MAGNFSWLDYDLGLVAFSGTPTFVSTDSTITEYKAHGPVDRGWSMPITSKSIATDGTGQTNQVVIQALPIGPDITHFLLVKRHSTTQGLSELILFIDTAVNLPFTPNGLDMVVNPDWLENRGWFRA